MYKVGQKVMWSRNGLTGQITCTSKDQIEIMWEDGYGHWWYNKRFSNLIPIPANATSDQIKALKHLFGVT